MTISKVISHPGLVVNFLKIVKLDDISFGLPSLPFRHIYVCVSKLSIIYDNFSFLAHYANSFELDPENRRFVPTA